MFKFLGKRGSPARQRKADDHHPHHDTSKHDSKRDTMLQEFQPYSKERHQSTVSEATTARASIDTTNFDERRESHLDLQPEVNRVYETMMRAFLTKLMTRPYLSILRYTDNRRAAA
jgi:hypothetical protein